MTTPSSRREFLKRASAVSMTGVAAPWALNLAAMGVLLNISQHAVHDAAAVEQGAA